MSDSGPRRISGSIEIKPHAYDPAANPELFEGVLARRLLAFIIDVVIISIPVLFATIFVFIESDGVIVIFGAGQQAR